MSTTEQKLRAAELKNKLIDLEILPSALRLPLNRVIDGDEAPGTAEGVIEYAKKVLGDALSATERSRSSG